MSSSTNGFTAHALQTHEYQASQPAVGEDINSVIGRLTLIKQQHDSLMCNLDWAPEDRRSRLVEQEAQEIGWRLHKLWKESLDFYDTFRAGRHEAIPIGYTRHQANGQADDQAYNQADDQADDQVCHQAYEDTNIFLQTLETYPTMPSNPILSADVVKSMRMGLQLAKLEKEASRRVPLLITEGSPPYNLAHLLEESVFEPFSLGIAPRDVRQWQRNRSTQGLPQNAEAPQTESTILADGGENFFYPVYHAYTDRGEAHPNLIDPERTPVSNFPDYPAISQDVSGGYRDARESGGDEGGYWQNRR